MVAIIGIVLEIAPILVLLPDSHLLEKVILLGVHVRNAPDQRQCLGHLFYFLVNIEVDFFLYVVHDLGHALII